MATKTQTQTQTVAPGSVRGAKGGSLAHPQTPAERAMSRRAVKAGVIGGLVVVYLALVGLVRAFADRPLITGVLNLGPTFIFAMYLVTGYTAARPVKARHGAAEPPPAPPGASLVAGVVAGAIAGAITVLLMLIGNTWDLTEIFVQLNERLVAILAFDRSVALGAALQIGVGAALGLLGAGMHLLPTRYRKPLFAALATTVLVSLGEPLLSGVLEGLGERIRLVFLDDPSWLYEAGGLTVFGTVFVFALTAGIVWFSVTRGARVRARTEALPENQRKAMKLASFILLVAAVLVLPQILTQFQSEVIGIVGLYVLLGLGLNIVVGYAGLLDLGYVAFFAIGAYGMALMTSPAAFTGGPVNFWVAVPIVVVAAVIAGILIGTPVLRLRGDYLAIVTLGFGEIVRIVIISDAAKPWTGGAQGILQIPSPALGGLAFNDPSRIYYLILVAAIAAAFIAYRLQGSRIGRAWVAMREDEQVAEAMGISIIKTKLLAFAMGAAIGSFSGMFFGAKIGSVFPHSMNILVSIQVLAVIVLGGMGSIPGVILGAFVLVGLPELLREFVEYRLHIYGAILVAIMLLKPEGLIPSARRRLELHEEEIEEGQFERRMGEETGAPVIQATATPPRQEG